MPGYLSYAGDMDVAIAIRTGIIKNGTCTYRRLRWWPTACRTGVERNRGQSARAAARGRTGGRRDWNERHQTADDRQLRQLYHNIVQYFGELGAQVDVFRNDAITLEGIAARAPGPAGVSPGPCSPAEAGISVAAIQHFMDSCPSWACAWDAGHRCCWAAPSCVRATAHARETSVITTTGKACSPGCPGSSR